MQVEIYINNKEINFEEFNINLSSNKLINSIQIYTNDKYNIDDEVYICINNINPYLIFKITSVISTIDSKDSRSDYLIVASSIEYELMKYYTTETIQFNPNISINEILNRYGFNNIGEGFNLLYTNELTINIGTNLGELISRILLEHGYILIEANKYALNICKVDKHSKSNIIEFIESIKLSENKIFDDVLIYSDNNIRNDENWNYNNTTYNGKLIKAHKTLLNTDNTSINEIYKNIAYRNKISSRKIELKLQSDDYNFRLNNILNVSKIIGNSSNDSFIINDIIIDETNLITLKGSLNV